jgi:hypothetical protein
MGWNSNSKWLGSDQRIGPCHRNGCCSSHFIDGNDNHYVGGVDWWNCDVNCDITFNTDTYIWCENTDINWIYGSDFEL